MTSPLSIAMAVVLGIICLASGLLLGAMPMQNSKMTERQRRVSSLLCFIIAIVYIVLLFSGQDMATWTMLGGIFAGFGIGKRVVMIGQIVATAGCNDVEIVVALWPDST